MTNNIWRKYNGALIPWKPPHLKLDLSKRQIHDAIIKNNALFARWTTNFDSKIKSPFWYIINDKPISFNDYSSNTKSKIKRGLKKLNVKIISKSELLSEGFFLYKKAIKRYAVVLNKLNKKEFNDEILGLDNSWQIWGVYCKISKKLVAYSLNRIVNNYCDYSTIKFDPIFLKYYSSYVLYYTMNKYYLLDNKFKYVNNGTRSISHQTNIHEFLIDKFKFRKAYCNIEVQYSLALKIIISILFSVRSIFLFIPFNFFRKISIVLAQEEIRKLCKKVYFD